jgi:hypothetical protein
MVLVSGDQECMAWLSIGMDSHPLVRLVHRIAYMQLNMNSSIQDCNYITRILAPASNLMYPAHASACSARVIIHATSFCYAGSHPLMGAYASSLASHYLTSLCFFIIDIVVVCGFVVPDACHCLYAVNLLLSELCGLMLIQTCLRCLGITILNVPRGSPS